MIIKTILFDFDGVVVDSEKLHLRALGEVLHNHGISYPDDLLNDFVGKNDSLFYQYVIDNLNSSYELDYLLKQKNKIFDKIVRELQPIDGFLDFIDVVIRKNIPHAIVTSSSGETLKMVSEIFPFQNYFDIVVAKRTPPGTNRILNLICWPWSVRTEKKKLRLSSKIRQME